MFPLLVASPHITTETVNDVAKIFTTGLYPLNEDAIVSTIYSMNNLLAVSEDGSPVPVLRERQLTITSGKILRKTTFPCEIHLPVWMALVLCSEIQLWVNFPPMMSIVELL